MESGPGRAGRYVTHLLGSASYRAFIPAPLPPRPSIRMDQGLTRLLSDADRVLGRLDGVASVLPNPDLFVAMYVRQEAVLSSQIEGTQSTLEDILEYEAHGATADQPRDIEEVVNYIATMKHGLHRLDTLPLSLRLLREIHGGLLTGVRGQDRQPGNFRTSQNWIGPSGCTLAEAEFVPPSPHDMQIALHEFENFLHERNHLPILVHTALAHAQFETIHPFLDGNGRVGRLLITLLLCERDILRQPLLYLSHYLKAHRSQYYDRLTAIRNEGDWESWVQFFLRGVFEVSQAATDTARAILDMREEHRAKVSGRSSANNALRLLDFLFERPLISVRMAEGHLGCSYVTAANIIDDFQHLGLLREITGQQRHRRYRYDPYIALFHQQVAV
ncbi:MAG: cell filamentation protein Fic [Bacteroidetes bacterium CG12_big_fil_rev_8_21_14_0_65_60_17]|nr:MAG: cell filamentation protein Fic [Bacteroidetes bacterium CG12_big_fil_rev_8_21_14_0_65_60_17]